MRSFVSLFIVMLILLPYKEVYGYGWGYESNENNIRPDIGQYERIIDEYTAFYADITDEKVIYLTFDNGYEEGYTSKFLDTLKKHDVPATFFVTGHYVESEPTLVKRMVDDGHIIGNHSYHHPDFTEMTKQEMKKELEMLEDAVRNVSTQKETMYLRPPRGTFNEKTLRWAEELGYVHIFWSLAYKDWVTDHQKGWEHAYDQVIKQVHPGAIVLLHTVSKDNADALDKIIMDLKEKGYHFKSLDDLMIKHRLPNEFMY